jgi:hypothetical protein
MKRILLALCVALVSTVAFAKGTLSLKPGFDPETGDRQIMTGLSVYQQIPADYLGLKLGYNGWVGGAMYEQDHTKNWVKIDNSVESYFGRFAVGVGGYVDHKPYVSGADEQLIYANFKMTLWN